MKMPSFVAPYVDAIKLVLLLAIVGFSVWGAYRIVTWRAAYKESLTVERVQAVIPEVLSDTDIAQEQKIAMEETVDEAREVFRAEQSKARYSNPAVAERADRVVPDVVRDNFRKRRLTREQSGRGEQ